MRKPELLTDIDGKTTGDEVVDQSVGIIEAKRITVVGLADRQTAATGRGGSRIADTTRYIVRTGVFNLRRRKRDRCRQSLMMVPGAAWEFRRRPRCHSSRSVKSAQRMSLEGIPFSGKA